MTMHGKWAGFGGIAHRQATEKFYVFELQDQVVPLFQNPPNTHYPEPTQP